MALSDTSVWTMISSEIVYAALRKVNAVGEGEHLVVPTALVNETTSRLNAVIKAFEADGMPLWRIQETIITPIAETQQYNIGEGQTTDVPAPLKVLQCYRRVTTDGETYDTPLILVSRYDWNLIPNKTAVGVPTHAFYQTSGAPNTTAVGALKVWPRPSTAWVAAAGTIVISYHRAFDDIEDPDDHLDFPQYFILALTWALADEIALEHGVPIAERAQIANKARELKKEALGFGVEEGSIRFVPEQMYLQQSKAK